MVINEPEPDTAGPSIHLVRNTFILKEILLVTKELEPDIQSMVF